MKNLTSPFHPAAVGLYAIPGTIGLGIATGVIQTEALELAIGPILVDLWGILLIISTLLCESAIFMAARYPYPNILRIALRVELIGSGMMSILLLSYEASLWLNNGFSVLITQIAITIPGLAAAGRSIQIFREKRDPVIWRNTQELTDNTPG